MKRSHALAKLLLGNVREVVSQLRETGAIDLAAALRPLTENVPSLDIQLDIEDPLNVEDPQRAHVLLRCTQEIITNAVRHAGGRHLWIKVYREAPTRWWWRPATTASARIRSMWAMACAACASDCNNVVASCRSRPGPVKASGCGRRYRQRCWWPPTKVPEGVR